MEILKTPDTPEEAQVNRNKMELQHQIIRTNNRIQYDRTINDRQRRHLRLEMLILEQDYIEFFGKDSTND